MPTKHARLHAQRGVGVVEILVAVLVLSIGLLGLAGLQMRTLRNSESSLERGVAVFETHAIADAMRADRANAMASGYDILLSAAAPTGSTFRARALAAWRQNLTSSLGQGATGQVQCNNSTLCTIIVQWDDSRAQSTGGTPTTFQVTTQVQL
jgi:type IV pilus assembly protein PilV